MNKEKFIELSKKIYMEANLVESLQTKSLSKLVRELEEMDKSGENYSRFVFYWKAAYKQLSHIIRSAKLHRKTKFLMNEYGLSEYQAIRRSELLSSIIGYSLKSYANKLLKLRYEEKELYKNGR